MSDPNINTTDVGEFGFGYEHDDASRAHPLPRIVPRRDQPMTNPTAIDRHHHAFSMLGRYVCVTAPGASFFGYLLSAHEAGSGLSCLLADSALWTQGMTKDLMVPGNQIAPKELPPSRRLGLAVVTMAMAVQPAGSFGPPAYHPCGAGNGQGLEADLLGAFVQGTANYLKMSEDELFQTLLKAYGQPKDGVGDEAAVIKIVAGAQACPDRVTASICLDAARQRVW